MDEGNKQLITFCKKCKLLELVGKVEELLNELDVTYEEIKSEIDA